MILLIIKWNTMELKPTDGNVLIKPLSKPDVTESGIVLPNTKTEVPQEGMVVALGRMVTETGAIVEPVYKEGDVVIFKKWEVMEYTTPDKGKLLFVKHKDILAIINKEETNG